MPIVSHPEADEVNPKTRKIHPQRQRFGSSLSAHRNMSIFKI
jgi:hypothetical protein